MNQPTQIPSGYRQNAVGHLVPEASIEEIDLLRDALVQDLIATALQMQTELHEFKRGAMADIESFVQLAGEKYGAKVGGVRGNVCLTSFDGRYRVLIQTSDRVAFDERIHIAKGLVDDCIQRWTADSSAQIKALIEHAFQVDKTGKINTGRVLSLTKLKIEDPDWQEAMKALKDSLQVLSSTAYIRFYIRRAEGELYDQVPLDLASA